MTTVNVARTFGPILLGALCASTLSGTVTVQTVYYIKNFHTDITKLKILVGVVWLLDALHTTFIWVSVWKYFISGYENANGIDLIPWSIALTISVTAVLTFVVHCFLAQRILRLSRRNWLLTSPIIVLACLRLMAAGVTSGEMIHLGRYSTFREQFRWVFTLGLALSSGVDFLITGSLFVLLRSSKVGVEGLNAIIDSLIFSAFETGFLTCAATIISMICWLTMQNNLIFLGLHFIIGKLYANSLLVTLNTRQNLRQARSDGFEDGEMPVFILSPSRRSRGIRFTSSDQPNSMSPSKSMNVQISVERSVQYTVDSPRGYAAHVSSQGAV